MERDLLLALARPHPRKSAQIGKRMLDGSLLDQRQPLRRAKLLVIYGRHYVAHTGQPLADEVAGAQRIARLGDRPDATAAAMPSTSWLLKAA